MSAFSTISRLIPVIAVTGSLLGGCSDYLDRRETVVLGAGNAVQTNIALHTIDPWPRNARNLRQATSGERTQHAIERYRNPRATAAPTEPTRTVESNSTLRPSN